MMTRLVASVLACASYACSSVPQGAAPLPSQPAAPPTQSSAPASAPANAAEFDPRADYPPVSPFRAMRQAGDGIEVQVNDDTWYQWRALDGIAAADLIVWSKEHVADDWWRRLNEDLPQVLALAGGHDGRLAVTLTLGDLQTGASVTLTAVAMTEKKRNELRRALHGASATGPDMVAVLTQAQWRADLEEFRDLLEQRFAYRQLGGVDVAAEVDAIRARLGSDPVPVWQLSAELAGLLGRFPDGHAKVMLDGRRHRPMPGVKRRGLPFLLRQGEGGVVAFKGDRSGLLDPAHPYLVAMDGRSIDDWLAAAGTLINRGSPQFVRTQALRRMRNIQAVRLIRGWTATDTVRIALADERGRTTERTMDVAAQGSLYGTWPKATDDVLPGNIGYLRIAEMTADQGPRIDASMKRFADTRALIVDVRGNGGGTRDILAQLFPYFMSPTDRPHVANVAAYRMTPDSIKPMPADGYLSNRRLFPTSYSGWSPAKRRAIKEFARTFKPDWQPRRDDFSEWHYMVIDRSDNPAAYHYSKPVIVLMNGMNFSATDIFLAALKGWRDVTLMGTPSGGGSARSRLAVLTHSKLYVKIASMASFRPNGRRYDGVGIFPDVPARPEPGYFVGASDKILDAALARLRK